MPLGDRLRPFVAALLGAAVTLLAVGVAMAPLVDRSDGTDRADGVDGRSFDAVADVVDAAPTTLPVATIPPPADLSTLLVDLGGRGFERVDDALAGAGPMDSLADLGMGAAVPAALGEATDDLGGFRGHSAAWVSSTGSAFVVLMVLEFADVTTASEFARGFGDSMARRPTAQPVDLGDIGGFGGTEPVTTDGGAELAFIGGAARLGRVYVVTVVDFVETFDHGLGPAIVRDQAAVG